MRADGRLAGRAGAPSSRPSRGRAGRRMGGRQAWHQPVGQAAPGRAGPGGPSRVCDGCQPTRRRRSDALSLPPVCGGSPGKPQQRGGGGAALAPALQLSAAAMAMAVLLRASSPCSGSTGTPEPHSNHVRLGWGWGVRCQVHSKQKKLAERRPGRRAAPGASLPRPRASAAPRTGLGSGRRLWPRWSVAASAPAKWPATGRTAPPASLGTGRPRTPPSQGTSTDRRAGWSRLRRARWAGSRRRAATARHTPWAAVCGVLQAAVRSLPVASASCLATIPSGWSCAPRPALRT